MEQVTNLWATRRSELLTQGQRVLEAIERGTPSSSSEPLTDSLLLQGATEILSTHDTQNGGFGGAPKFPQAPVLELLLRMSGRVPGVADALKLTFHKMALGGIYDQLGGGFARYAVDETWTVPHFEKMLYDNAQLARAYTHAFQAYADPLYRRIATETLDYMLYDLRDDPLQRENRWDDPSHRSVRDDLVTELRDNTFYASITVQQNGSEIEIDSRPSDAIAIAVRSDAPIFAAERVIEESAIEFEGEDVNEEEIVDEFKKFLDDVSPDQFAVGEDEN
jgi:hypothetical protein